MLRCLAILTFIYSYSRSYRAKPEIFLFSSFLLMFMEYAHFLVLFMLVGVDANITCYECEYVNWRFENTLWPCDQSAGPWRKLHNCIACIKQTEVQKSDFRKPRWGQEETVIKATSRYCITHFNPIYPNQCIYWYGSASVIEQCYCDTELCNAAHTITSNSLPALILISVFLFFT